MSTTTLKNQILTIARRRLTKGVTVAELTATIQTNFMNNDGTTVPASSIRARTYELAQDGELFNDYDYDTGNDEKRNGARVFRAE